jgi:hypothetical protein
LAIGIFLTADRDHGFDAQFTDGLATQYGQLFKAHSNRLDAVEKGAFGPNYNQPPSMPSLN